MIDNKLPEINPSFERNELVWIRVSPNGCWEARFYSHKNHGKHYVFSNQNKSGNTFSPWYIVKFDDMPMLNS